MPHSQPYNNPRKHAGLVVGLTSILLCTVQRVMRAGAQRDEQVEQRAQEQRMLYSEQRVLLIRAGGCLFASENDTERRLSALSHSFPHKLSSFAKVLRLVTNRLVPLS